MKEKKDPAILEAFLSLVLLLFLRYNPRFPLAYKRESGAPHEGDPEPIDPSRFDTDPHKKHDTNIWLSSDRALSTRSLLPLETCDPFPLICL